MDALITLGVIIVTVVFFLLFWRRWQAGVKVGLRPLPPFAALEGHVGKAIESASQLHISLGRASLIGPANPTSIAALTILDHMARDGCANGTPPLTTVGEGTLLPVAQESLRYAYQQAEQSRDFKPGLAQFIANEKDAMVYAAGVGTLLEHEKVISNVLVGRFGPEIALITEAAERQHMEQVIGSDDPVALSLAIAYTENVLIGEELLAAGAYLEGHPSQIISLQVQDVLRWLVVAGILGSAIWRLVGGS